MKSNLLKRSRKYPSLWNERTFELIDNTHLFYTNKRGETKRIPNEFCIGTILTIKRKTLKTLYAIQLDFQDAKYTSLQIGSEDVKITEDWQQVLQHSIALYQASKSKNGNPPLLPQANWYILHAFGHIPMYSSIPPSHIATLHGVYEMFPIIFIASLALIVGGLSVTYTLLLCLLSSFLLWMYQTQKRLALPWPTLKLAHIITASPKDVKTLLFETQQRAHWDATITSIDIIDTLDEMTDIVHIVYAPVWVWPIWLPPLDGCFIRYWRKESNGAYVITLTSIVHPACPVTRNIRLFGQSGYIIAPCKEGQQDQCLVTQEVSLYPTGALSSWLSRTSTNTTYLSTHLSSLLCLGHVFQNQRFVEVDCITSSDRTNSRFSSRFSSKNTTASSSFDSIDRSESMPLSHVQGNLDPTMWSESDVSMLVRGPDYLTDRRKIPSAPPAFRLVAIDFFETESPMEHISTHPETFLQRDKIASGGKSPFTFVIHFLIPVKTCVSMVLYYRANRHNPMDHSPLSELLHDFMTNDDDRCRDERFKLIPCIVEGPFIVRQAVGSTPTLIGKKLSQIYYKGDGYYEVDIDIASSAVANRVTGLALGYTKKMVIDLGFLLEGQFPDELPERLLGTVRFTRVDLSSPVRIAPHHNEGGGGIDNTLS